MITNCPTSVLASLFEITEREIQKLTVRGILARALDPVTGKTLCGRYPLAESILLYTRFLKNRVAGLNEGDDEYRRHKIALLQAQVEEAELHLAALKRSLHRAEDVKMIMDARDAFIRRRCLSLPEQLATQVLDLTNVATINERLSEGILVLLDDLSGYDPSADSELVAYFEKLITESASISADRVRS